MGVVKEIVTAAGQQVMYDGDTPPSRKERH
jgi:hypothetical protein